MTLNGIGRLSYPTFTTAVRQPQEAPAEGALPAVPAAANSGEGQSAQLGGGSAQDARGRASSLEKAGPKGECQTCNSRKYQDGSDDPGVSYKTPTKLSADAAPAAVLGHERQHVGREQAKAAREGRKVVSQSVTIHNAVCPECGRVYVSGGTTRTVTKGQSDQAQKFAVGREDPSAQPGANFNAVA